MVEAAPAGCRRFISVMLAVGFACGAGGCVAGSLATSTGPRAGGEWSIARTQQVHVGETVAFSFVLRHPVWSEAINAHGMADYCAFEIGDERIETGINADGGFQTTHAFVDLRPGEKVVVKATAYQARGNRDRMKVAGAWMENNSPYNERDTEVAKASLQLVGYQCAIQLELPKRADAFDFATGQLVLRRNDGGNTVVYQHRPPRAGFSVAADDNGEIFQVTYLPTGDQLSPSGTTEVVFTVYDQAGNRQVFTRTIDTP